MWQEIGPWPVVYKMARFIECSFRRNEDRRRSVKPAAGRQVAGSKVPVASLWRSWRRWGFCGLSSGCVFSASDRVKLPPALWRSSWSKCTGWGSRHCWLEGWRWQPSLKLCLKRASRSQTIDNLKLDLHVFFMLLYKQKFLWTINWSFSKLCKFELLNLMLWTVSEGAV